jgi:nucleotide-binding universal stress UspA family protein
MFTIKTILHPTDFSDSANEALAHALRIARRHQATLHLLNVAPSLGEDPVRSAYSIGAGESAVYQKMADRAQELMDALIDESGAGDLEEDIVRVHDRGVAPGPVINDYAQEHDVDLIVMGTHGRRGVERFMLGSVAEEVVRHAPCSVMTVRRTADGAQPPAIDRILVPVDLSEYTVPLFRAALNVASTYSARVDLLHVVEPLPFPVPLVGALTIHDLVPDPTEQSESQLANLAESMTHEGVNVTPHVEEGHAAATIVAQAEALDSDLIMIASHGLSGVERFLLGSVTARVVRRAHCPVLVARVEPESVDA